MVWSLVLFKYSSSVGASISCVTTLYFSAEVIEGVFNPKFVIFEQYEQS